MDKLVVDGKVTEIRKDIVKDINLNTADRSITLQKAAQPYATTSRQHISGSQHHNDVTRWHCTGTAFLVLRFTSSPCHTTSMRTASKLTRDIWIILKMMENGAQGRNYWLIKDHNIHNKLVCVTRWYGGTRLGKNRFDYIINAAKDSLNITWSLVICYVCAIVYQ